MEGEEIEKKISGIHNYYGGILVKSENGLFYWGIENYDGWCWEEIPQSLFSELNKFQDERES